MSDNRLTLENDFLRVAFVRHGAELQQLYYKTDGIDLLWSGDTAYWGKHSPILFPIVGTLKDNEYIYQDVRYSLGRHGFARDKEFELIAHESDSIEFKLRHDEDTLRIYPFHFELIVRYDLVDACLSCTYKVTNISPADPLLFSIGAHPAFAIPFREQYSYRDYFIQFNQDTSLARYPLTVEGLLHPTSVPMELDRGKLPLSMELFYRDAIVIKQINSDVITLGNSKDSFRMEMHIKDFPFLGIWAARDAPFICLEPWFGLADSTDHNKKLELKEGIIKLEPNSEWVKSWKISVKTDR